LGAAQAPGVDYGLAAAKVELEISGSRIARSMRTDISRRTFLRVASAATAGGLLTAYLGRAGDDKQDFAGFHVGIQSYCFRDPGFGLEKAIQLTHDLGLRWIEFFDGKPTVAGVPVGSTPSQVSAVVAFSQKMGVTPDAWGVHVFTKDHASHRPAFEVAKNLGVKVITADPHPASLDSLDKLVAEYQIGVGIHPHGPQKNGELHRWYSAEVIMKAVKDHNPLIGSCLDTGHLIRAARMGHKLDPVEEIKIMGNRNHAIHLKDNDNARDVNVVLGRAALDVKGVLQALRDVHFQGPISIEYEANSADPVPDIRECIKVVREAAKGLK
jgi:inosose dehydratase